MKKGYFFTLDAFLALGIIIVGMVIIYGAYSFAPDPQQTQSYAQDTLALFTTASLQDLNDDYINFLLEKGFIENEKNTLLEQIGEFYFHSNITGDPTYLNKAEEMIDHLTQDLVEQEFGAGFYVDGVKVFERPRFLGNNYTKILLTSKVPVVGVYNTTVLWGPYLIEVRIWQ